MITLITGAPGSGKTLLAVTEFLLEASRDNRQIVVDGIPELQVGHVPAPPLVEWTRVVEDPHSQDGEKLLFNFPDGALVVIDEAQRVYRPRPVGSKVPPEVAAFETHRHQGLDFLILTQHPNLIDANVRKLVGRHIHIRELGILGRRIYEWPEVGNPERWAYAPIQRVYKLDKKSFAVYKSASLHVKPQRGLPKGVLAVALAVPLLLGGSYLAYQSIQKKIVPPGAVVEVTNKAAAQPVAVASAAPVVDPSAMFVEFVPRIAGRPETAPAYDELRQVKNLPVVAGCVLSAKRCVCQTQTGTEAGLSREQCLAWIANPPFDSYREPVVVSSPSAPPSPKAATVGASGAVDPTDQAATFDRNKGKDPAPSGSGAIS